MDQEETEFTITIVIADTHARSPMSSQATLQITTHEPDAAVVDFGSLLSAEEEGSNDLPAPVITYEPVDYLDNLQITFSELMLLPKEMSNYTETNEGATVFRIAYLPSVDTLDYFY